MEKRDAETIGERTQILLELRKHKKSSERKEEILKAKQKFEKKGKKRKFKKNLQKKLEFLKTMLTKFVLKLKQKRKGKMTKQLIDMSFRFEKFPVSINQVMSGNSETIQGMAFVCTKAYFRSIQKKNMDKLYEGRLFAVLRLYQNDYKTRDVDNYLKIVFDAFKRYSCEDDEVFDIILIYKVKGKPYTSDIAEIQILDMEKPIILSELIPKNDYIWIREKNNKTTNKIVTASGILGSGKKLKQSIDSMLEQKKKENEDFFKNL